MNPNTEPTIGKIVLGTGVTPGGLIREHRFLRDPEIGPYNVTIIQTAQAHLKLCTVDSGHPPPRKKKKRRDRGTKNKTTKPGTTKILLLIKITARKPRQVTKANDRTRPRK